MEIKSWEGNKMETYHNNNETFLGYNTRRTVSGIGVLVTALALGGCTEIADPCHSYVDKLCGCPKAIEKEAYNSTNSAIASLMVCLAPGISSAALKGRHGYLECLGETLAFNCPK